MVFSETSKVVGPLLARQLYMMAKEYDNVIDFTIGDPDIPTDKAICQAACNAAMTGHTRYSANAGIPELRDAISKWINQARGTNYAANNIVTTIGATEALFIAYMALLNRDDEVIVLAPYWIQYENMAKFFGAKAVIIDKFSKGFEPDIQAIKDAITPKTKVIVINSPNNPSGWIYREDTLRAIADLAKEHGLFVFSDECYEALTYSGKYNSIAQFCDKSHLVLFNSFSKAFAMTGWRVGFLAADEELVANTIKMHQNIAICASVPSQYAALEAITHADEYSSSVRHVFTDRRKVLLNELERVQHIHYNAPDGTFYVFIDISETGMTSKDFTFCLLKKEQVAVIPGIAYGDAFDQYIRLAFTMDENKIIEGVRRIKTFIDNIIK